MDAPRLGIDLLEQVLDEGYEVGFGAAAGDFDSSLTPLGFHGHEQVARAGTHVFIIQRG